MSSGIRRFHRQPAKRRLQQVIPDTAIGPQARHRARSRIGVLQDLANAGRVTGRDRLQNKEG